MKTSKKTLRIGHGTRPTNLFQTISTRSSKKMNARVFKKKRQTHQGKVSFVSRIDKWCQSFEDVITTVWPQEEGKKGTHEKKKKRSLSGSPGSKWNYVKVSSLRTTQVLYKGKYDEKICLYVKI